MFSRMMAGTARIAALAAVLALMASCHGAGPEGAGTEGGLVPVTLRYPSAASYGTRASDLEQTPGEVAVNTLDVLVYRADGSGALDARHSATGAELEARTVSLKVPFGRKSVYLVANGPDGYLSKCSTEAGLRSLVSSLGDNSRDSFVMIGTPGGVVSLEPGKTSDFNVTLRRLAARVSVRSVTADYTSPAWNGHSLVIRRVALVNVNPDAPLCHGDVTDAFGKAVDGRYSWPYPMGDGLEGFVNPAVLTDGELVLTGDSRLRDLTVYGMPGDGYALYPSATGSGSWTGRALMYAMPNQRPDLHGMTKLVIETVLDGDIRWYSFEIPDIQPNTAYTFSSVTLLRPGNTNPNEPMETGVADVHIEVLDWETGEVLGSYNDRGWSCLG